MPDWAEDTLGGLDAPRPLPPELAARLQQAILEASRALEIEGRSLGDQLAGQLEDALTDPLVPLMDDLDAPRPLGPGARRRLEQALGARGARRVPVLTAVAAAVVVLAGVGLAVNASTGGGNGGRVPAQAARPGGTGGVSPRSSASATPGAASNAGVGSSGSAAGGTTGQTPNSPLTALGPAPEVTGLDPSSGPASGGTWVVISGPDLAEATAVSFGAVPATAYQVVSANQVRAEAPPEAAGTVDVRVTTPSGTSPLSPADRFTYTG